MLVVFLFLLPLPLPLLLLLLLVVVLLLLAAAAAVVVVVVVVAVVVVAVVCCCCAFGCRSVEQPCVARSQALGPSTHGQVLGTSTPKHLHEFLPEASVGKIGTSPLPWTVVAAGGYCAKPCNSQQWSS